MKQICGISCDDQVSFNSFCNVSCSTVNETVVPLTDHLIEAQARSVFMEVEVHVCTVAMNPSISSRFFIYIIILH